ncbi:MAG: preprotein translocase subunit SecG [Ramlibacter sp.]|jgi:preprotein translocase subunit SecG|uniref:preprotein translocase subunit SecG n=1 Tax=Ramlibacter sp. TaxID=1917967 RepID=UPI0026069B81|nr:preprotein translocase subunit SecG [Ramlibacter sp.]MDH4374870.1 preprotein translocase subunit SecG [Ramlibacter sp.]
MSFLFNVILTAQMLSALGVIGLVLVQHGKGADMGAAFGSGTSGSLFGATGSANFLSRATAVLATVFFASTLALAYLGTHRPSDSGSVLDRAAAPAAAPASAASGAAGQIPSGGSVPVPSTPAAPAVPASGAGQIPGR